MKTPVMLAATWTDGVFVFVGDTRRHELAGRSVRALASDDVGSVLAIVDGHSLCRRARDGEWRPIATTELDLACLMVVADVIYVGTDDARVLRVGSSGEIGLVTDFATTPGRDTWYAGSAMINGRLVGPPLGVRSMTATADGAVLLANVHVGGVPRSTDGGATWQPTIAVESDVHEVCAHPVDPRLVIAASAAGLWISRDGGGTWTVEREGLYGLHCTAVAFSANDILVSAATDHFADRGEVYRRPIDGDGPLKPIGGLPEWLDGIVDTGCIASAESALAIADKGGNVYVSEDAGHSWAQRGEGLPMVSKLLLI